MRSPIAEFKNFWAEVPPIGRTFIIRGLLMFLLWKVSYQSYLKPTRIIDSPLTTITSAATTKLLSSFYPNDNFTFITYFGGSNIYKNGQMVLFILDPCNALEVFVVYFIFVLAFPTSFARQVIFIVIGVIEIFALNIIRCSLIAYLNMFHKIYTDIAHHYVFSIVLYGCILGLWARYLYKKTNRNETAVG